MGVRVVIVDDHEVVRAGLRDLLEAEEDLTVVGEAGSAQAGLDTIMAERPDVAVVDVRLPDRDGISMCAKLRDAVPDLACIVLTSYADDDALQRAAEVGAAAFLLKDLRTTDLVASIRTVAAGGSLLDSEDTGPVLDRMHRGDVDHRRLADLTERERSIFGRLGEGMTNRQIAAELGLAEKTIKNNVSNILLKLGMDRRTQAAAFAARVDERRRRDDLGT